VRALQLTLIFLQAMICSLRTLSCAGVKPHPSAGVAVQRLCGAAQAVAATGGACAGEAAAAVFGAMPALNVRGGVPLGGHRWCAAAPLQACVSTFNTAGPCKAARFAAGRRSYRAAGARYV